MVTAKQLRNLAKGRRTLSKMRKTTRNSSKYKQTGARKSVRADLARKATKPGMRTSRNGKRYHEARRNRTDVPPGRL